MMMTQEQAVLIAISNSIKSLPFDKQLAINDAALKIREVVEHYNNGGGEVPYGSIALALVGAQFSAED